MIPYKDLGGDSGVQAYECGETRIQVRFNTGAVYEYTDASAGSAHIEAMKQLARQGDGLNAYINRHVKKAYSRRVV